MPVQMEAHAETLRKLGVGFEPEALAGVVGVSGVELRVPEWLIAAATAGGTVTPADRAGSNSPSIRPVS